mgnify:CR=1 FL=1
MRITWTALLCLVLVGCGGESTNSNISAEVEPAQTFNWKLVTTWPKNFPGLGLAPEHFAENVERMACEADRTWTGQYARSAHACQGEDPFYCQQAGMFGRMHI